MLVILCCVIVFHLLVLVQILPYQIVWGGRLQNVTQMRQFEAVSIVINVLMIAVTAIKGNYLKLNIPGKALNVVIWILVVLFTLNTIGNLLAKTSTETLIFTPITFILAILSFRIALGEVKAGEQQQPDNKYFF